MLLLRDGTLYFGALTVTNLVTLTLDVVAYFHPELVGATFFVVISEALGPILVARFILDLRSVYYPDHSSVDKMSTVHFSAVLGNLAAPVRTDSLWTTGTSHDFEDNHGSYQRELSKHPLSYGLEVQPSEYQLRSLSLP